MDLEIYESFFNNYFPNRTNSLGVFGCKSVSVRLHVSRKMFELLLHVSQQTGWEEKKQRESGSSSSAAVLLLIKVRQRGAVGGGCGGANQITLITIRAELRRKTAAM